MKMENVFVTQEQWGAFVTFVALAFVELTLVVCVSLLFVSHKQ